MKKIMLTAAFAMAVAAFSAFGFANRSGSVSAGEIYWEFIGSSGQESNPAMYVEVEGNFPTCDGNSTSLCNILADRDALHTDQPDLSTEVLTARTFKP